MHENNERQETEGIQPESKESPVAIDNIQPVKELKPVMPSNPFDQGVFLRRAPGMPWEELKRVCIQRLMDTRAD